MKKLLLISLLASSLIASDEPATAAAASTSQDAKPRLALLKSLVGHRGGIAQVKFSAYHPHLLASASSDKTVKIWNVNDGACMQSITCQAEPQCVAFMQDKVFMSYNELQVRDRIIVGALDNTVQVIDMETGAVMTHKRTRFTPNDIALSPSGQHIAVGTKTWGYAAGCNGDADCYFYNTQSHAIDYGIDSFCDVHKIVFAPNGDAIIADAYDLYRLNPQTRTRVASSQDNTLAGGVIALSPDDSTLIYANKKGIRRFDAKTLKKDKDITGGGAFAVEYTADGKYIILGALDQTLKVMDPHTGIIIDSLPLNPGFTSINMESTIAGINVSEKYDVVAKQEIIAQVLEMTKSFAEISSSIACSIDNRFIASSSLHCTDIKILALQ